MPKLKIGEVNKYFQYAPDDAGRYHRAQAGSYDYNITAVTGGGYRVVIWKNTNSNAPVIDCLLSQLKDGDNADAVFATPAALESWLEANFFF